jgi:phosphopantothenoylcysteine decarboxylase/phosphopantothenate--cysteine ligase
MPSIAFGICGSISAAKSLDVIRKLREYNINITPILSISAPKFVTPWSVETFAERPILTKDVINGTIGHLSINASDLFVICPASANTISKLANGQCNDMLSASFLSFKGKKIIFPAMHTEMWDASITSNNIKKLKASGVIVISPDIGPLACGDTGIGRLPNPHVIAQLIMAHVQASIPLHKKNIVITCGGTSEPIDPVRGISNRSSGLLGHTIANIAASYGAHVSLIRTATHPTLSGIHCIAIQTSAQLQKEVLKHTSCDMLIMAAAVSDFTVAAESKKLRRGHKHTLQLNPTPDILADFNKIKSPQCTSVGFCLTDDPHIVEIALKKMNQKKCDIMVANGPESFGQTRRSIHLMSSTQQKSCIDYPIETIAVEILKFSAPHLI